MLIGVLQSDLGQEDTKHKAHSVPAPLYGPHKPSLVPFQSEHLKSFRPGCFDREAMRGLDLDTLAPPYEGHAVSMVVDGRTLAIAGAAEVDGVVKVWALVSDEARERYPVFLHRSLRRGLRWVTEDIGTDIIELAVADGFEVGHKWVQRLGFVVFGKQFKDGFVRYMRW